MPSALQFSPKDIIVIVSVIVGIVMNWAMMSAKVDSIAEKLRDLPDQVIALEKHMIRTDGALARIDGLNERQTSTHERLNSITDRQTAIEALQREQQSALSDMDAGDRIYRREFERWILQTQRDNPDLPIPDLPSNQ